ncbi:MAG: ATP-dependent Clp protease proteolytic subunit [Pseudomonadota bacterium]
MAERRNARGQAFLLVAALAVMAMLAWRNDRAVYADKGRLAVRVEDDAAVLTWIEGVDVPMARRIDEAYQRLGGEVDAFVLELHSPGGSVLEGRAVIGVLDRVRSTHDLITVVGPGRECLSMCVPIFLSGEMRLAARDATFMFHEPTSRNVLTGARERRPAFEERRATEKFLRRYFEDSPMDPVWRERLAEDWKGEDVWKTGAELVEERAGVVTGLLGE